MCKKNAVDSVAKLDGTGTKSVRKREQKSIDKTTQKNEQVNIPTSEMCKLDRFLLQQTSDKNKIS